MAWMKVDDRLHSHRKTRAVIRSHADKSRDIAPMGIWVAAGSWAAQNGTEGWIPEDELDRFDDDWKQLTARLVDSGYWWPEDHDGEVGYGFNDWHDYNPSLEAASASGEYGNHVRWHVNRKKVDPDCDHCPKEPTNPESTPEIPPDSGGDRVATSGGDSDRNRDPIALSDSPNPTPPHPTPNPKRLSAAAERDFAEWYAAYPKKVAKGAAIKAYRTARKKADAATLLAAITSQAPRMLAGETRFIPNPATWLNAERWSDEPAATIASPSQLPPVETSWMERR